MEDVSVNLFQVKRDIVLFLMCICQCLSQFDDDVEIEVVEYMSFIDCVVQEFVQSSGVYNINIIIAGDFNSSLHNIYNDYRLNAARSSINDLGLVCCDDIDVSGVGYTFYNEIL